MGDQEKFDELAKLARWRLKRLERLEEGSLAPEPPDVAEQSLAGETPTYFYRPGELLSTEAAVDRVEDGLRQLGVAVTGRSEAVPGVVKLEVRSISDMGAVDLPATLRRLRSLLPGGAGPDAPAFGPNHLFFPAPWNTVGPATEPELPRGTVLQARDAGAGKGVKVAIIDTGLLEEPLPLSLQHDIVLGPDAVEDPDYDRDGFIDPVAAHGTFIAALIRQIAPATTLHVEAMIDKAGVFSELDLAQRIHAVLDDNEPPDIINLSLGGHTDLSAAPVALASVWARLERQDKTIVVAAAGNSGRQEKFWPAASTFALGVGALGVDGRRAWFSNYGDWVDVWAPGEHLLSAYAAGPYLRRPSSTGMLNIGRRLVDVLPIRLRSLSERLRNVGPVLHFDGDATWSGTSFATPLVVGAIAALMSARGIGARAAQEELEGQSLQVLDLATFGTT